MRNARGITLVELIITMAVVLLAMTFSVIFWLPGIARENMRGAVFDVQACMQLARVEAVSRNTECSCVIRTATRTLQVIDSRGTPSLGDDEQLHVRGLPDAVIFARPDTGPAVTLPALPAPDSYSAGFRSDGALASAQGDVFLFGGDSFGRISLLGAGGTRVSKWINNAWVTGS